MAVELEHEFARMYELLFFFFVQDLLSVFSAMSNRQIGGLSNQSGLNVSHDIWLLQSMPKNKIINVRRLLCLACHAVWPGDGCVFGNPEVGSSPCSAGRRVRFRTTVLLCQTAGVARLMRSRRN